MIDGLKNRHMRLNDLEKCIIIAERDYRTFSDKLNYVNLKLQHGKEIDKNTGMVKPYPNHKKLIIKHATYYRKLGELESKSKIRAQNIVKTILPALVNEHDVLIQDRIEVREMMINALHAEKHMAATRLKLAQIELGKRIFAVKQNIATLMERPSLESGEDTFGEQIRLLTALH